jgi:hypothetical protein
MTVAAMVDVGVGSAAGAQSGVGTSAQFGMPNPGASGLGLGGATGLARRSGGALIAASAGEGIASSVATIQSAINSDFRSQWEAELDAQGGRAEAASRETGAEPNDSDAGAPFQNQTESGGRVSAMRQTAQQAGAARAGIAATMGRQSQSSSDEKTAMQVDAAASKARTAPEGKSVRLSQPAASATVQSGPMDVVVVPMNLPPAVPHPAEIDRRGGLPGSMNALSAAAVQQDNAMAAASGQKSGAQDSIDVRLRSQGQAPVLDPGNAPDSVLRDQALTDKTDAEAALQAEPAAPSMSDAALTQLANASAGEESKLQLNGPDAKPVRGKSPAVASVPSLSSHGAQSAESSMDQALLSRVTAGEGSVAVGSSHAGTGGSATSPTAAGSAGGTFAALDAQSAVGTPGWIHASGQRAEAGFEDPVLGWVGVRADVAGGGVHAALLPGSAEAAAVLSTHLTGLGTYLSEQHAPVSSLTMAAPGQQGMESGVGQSLEQGPQQNDGGNSRAGQETGEPASAATHFEAASRTELAESSGVVPVDSMGGMRGAHVSVMA